MMYRQGATPALATVTIHEPAIVAVPVVVQCAFDTVNVAGGAFSSGFMGRTASILAPTLLPGLRTPNV